jgi:hypothetical protein
MEFESNVLVSPTTEVPVIEGQVVNAIRMSKAETDGQLSDRLCFTRSRNG